MKTTLLLAVAALVPGMFLMQANGGTSVVIVDFDRVVAEAPGAKDAISKINAFQNEQIAEIGKKEKEASEIENRLRIQGNTLSEATRTQLARTLETTRTTIQTMGEDAQKKLGQMHQELIAPIEQKTATAVNRYAQENGVKIVLDASTLQNGLVYVHDTADITTEVIRRIAADLRTPEVQDASLRNERMLNRKWIDFEFRK
jgi:Skp family chaperone for outer membrane proteins